MKKLIILALSLVLCLIAVSALAETGVAYGVYSMEGEHPDSLIRATVEVTDGAITAVDFDEKLIPVAVGGADGWAKLEDGTNAPAVVIDGQIWSIDENGNVTNDEKGEFFAYVTTDEGGDWYFAQMNGDLLDADGNVTATVEIGTKESIEHGVHFWVSEIMFPGNIAALEQFVVDNGVNYTLADMVKGDDGFWAVADTVTGATLAGAPNYLLLAQAAFEKVAK